MKCGAHAAVQGSGFCDSEDGTGCPAAGADGVACVMGEDVEQHSHSPALYFQDETKGGPTKSCGNFGEQATWLWNDCFLYIIKSY